MASKRHVHYVRKGRLPSDLWRVRAYEDDSIADGTIAEAEGIDGAALWSVVEASPGLARVEIAPDALPEHPPLWFVWVDEPRASPAATNLVAFSHERFVPGTIVSHFTFATAGVSNDDQVGAVRWYPDGGLVHQIFVKPEWRRWFVASALLFAADAFHQAKGWSGALHGDGRRTDLGQLFAAALRYPQRITALTDQMPSMDPNPQD
ncbi:GNAT superfamily N-acetyltransferase [Microbacteriaceae bacterium SG_E_30_P1]|uniref:GNAT superfamily N-acetyltransferase n=1 Tax=Antiquaquibacter oligotrophicus TaxID=2880260 RepID=A0ABT6KNT6_9MICO|nr:hypothetical protein [Antiquaquibacter oligotrophicus]MDH6181534.1 GNAT superfamily N-acetyltransferase [Antiquaquibacter oligotrophicus]UDF12777.1 hypothetical protein LH407_11520 [Antiquaquibacter oligotrophicus]